MDAAEYTYEDAARACGVTTETIRQRARRGKLTRGRPTNTGRPTVYLSEEDIKAIAAGRPFIGQPVVRPSGQPSGQAVQPDGQPTAESLIVKAMEGEAAILRESLKRERDRADRAEAQAVEARALAGQQTASLTAALVQAATAEGKAEELRAALAEARRPAWRRWLGRD